MTDAITAGAILRRRAETVTEVLDGEAVVLEERSRTVHVLSPTATAIWENLDGEMSLEELAAALSDAFGAPLDLVLADTLDAVGRFAEHGLLEGFAPPGEGDAAPLDAAGSNAGSDEREPPRFLRQPPHG